MAIMIITIRIIANADICQAGVAETRQSLDLFRLLFLQQAVGGRLNRLPEES